MVSRTGWTGSACVHEMFAVSPGEQFMNDSFYKIVAGMDLSQECWMKLPGSCFPGRRMRHMFRKRNRNGLLGEGEAWEWASELGEKLESIGPRSSSSFASHLHGTCLSHIGR